MAVDDTRAHAKAVQQAALATMEPGDRMLAAMAMADEVKQITLAGIRVRNPYLDEEDAYRAWFTILHGTDMATEVLGPES